MARQRLTIQGRRRLIAGGLIALAALLGYAAAVWMYPAPLVTRDQRVRLVIGLPVEEAERELTTQGFRVKILDAREQDPTLPEGYVTWQEPVAGMAMPEGHEVDLTVSGGAAQVTVPDVLQFDAEDARRVLTAAGLAVSGVDSLPSNADPGLVVATRPTAGTARTPGASVELVVSRGPAAIRVPDLAGKSDAEARALLDQVGLRVGTVRKVSGRATGNVVNQNPRAGVQVPRGSRVDLTVTETRRP